MLKNNNAAERRKSGTLSAGELSEVMFDLIKKFYEDSIVWGVK